MFAIPMMLLPLLIMMTLLVVLVIKTSHCGAMRTRRQLVNGDKRMRLIDTSLIQLQSQLLLQLTDFLFVSPGSSTNLRALHPSFTRHPQNMAGNQSHAHFCEIGQGLCRPETRAHRCRRRCQSFRLHLYPLQGNRTP
jgi:hypothetical protein